MPKEGVSFSEEIQIYPRKPFIPESGKGEHSMKQPQRKILPHLATCTEYTRNAALETLRYLVLPIRKILLTIF